MRAERGAVSLEVLLVLPLVVLVLAALVGLTAVIGDELAVTQAARAGARAAALSGDVGEARRVAGAVVPDARVGVSLRGGVVTVQVERRSGWLGRGLVVDATATAPLEPVTRRARSP